MPRGCDGRKEGLGTVIFSRNSLLCGGGGGGGVGYCDIIEKFATLRGGGAFRKMTNCLGVEIFVDNFRYHL